MIIVHEGLPNAFSLNARVDRHSRSERTRRAKREFMDTVERHIYRTPGFMVGCPISPAELKLTFCLDTGRRKDLDNLMAACKPWIDVLVDMGILEDDDFKHLPRITLECKRTSKPYVLIKIIPFLRD